jgi:hypothetical protein
VLDLADAEAEGLCGGGARATDRRPGHRERPTVVDGDGEHGREHRAADPPAARPLGDHDLQPCEVAVVGAVLQLDGGGTEQRTVGTPGQRPRPLHP